MILHDLEVRRIGSMGFRKVNRKWQYWDARREMWVNHPDNLGPKVVWGDTELSYDDTWCEPFEGMDQ